jgi:acetate kinase
MKVLVLNCGSSSVKYKLFDMAGREVMAQGGAEKVGIEGSFLKFTLPSGEKVVLEKELPDHTDAIEFILSTLVDGKYGCIKSFNEIEAVGHRVVHGAETFSKSQRITPQVVRKLVECIELAPLHNPPNLEGIRAMQKLLPGVPQVAVFDTAFHQTMPDYAYMYGLPYDAYEKYGIRRYGFHGTSHRYVSARACEVLGIPYDRQRIVTAHIGNGASMAAVKYGECIDTSMGLTPQEGLLMGTRAGDLDAGALLYLMEKENLDVKAASELLNKKSGVLGLSGLSSDMREIEAAVARGDERAVMALAVYNYRIKKYVGAYAAAMGGIDVLVFTGGVGENQWTTREAVCTDMEYMGIRFDREKNHGMRGEEMVISTSDSPVTVIVVPTDEEYLIASDTVAVVKDKL